MKLGDRVRCTGYIKKSGNRFETDDPTGRRQTECAFWPAGAEAGEPVEDYQSCDRFAVVPLTFEGIFVGTTKLNTVITAEWCEPPYGNPHFEFYTENQQPFGVVYYSDNKKRLVPMDMIEVTR